MLPRRTNIENRQPLILLIRQNRHSLFEMIRNNIFHQSDRVLKMRLNGKDMSLVPDMMSRKNRIDPHIRANIEEDTPGLCLFAKPSNRSRLFNQERRGATKGLGIRTHEAVLASFRRDVYLNRPAELAYAALEQSQERTRFTFSVGANPH